DTVVAPRGWKCSLCTKVLKKVKAMVGKDPDEAAVLAALARGCRALGGGLARTCRRLLDKRGEKIREVLRDGDPPRAACTAIGLCR
ncbi:NKL protein, partial [Nyctiprogne leucopyga]|nr:NKL protein [Nyctiprogne leucopyga]